MIIKRERNLLEAYKSRLAISEKVYNREHGDTFTESKKSTVAACLNNISKFLTERFDNSVGTQRADLGTFKKFTMDITTVALN